MSEEEYEVLDELYFVTGYHELRDQLSYPDEQLCAVLHSLSDKGWIRILADPDEELPSGSVDWASGYRSYFYLASKAGLMAHNTK